MSSRLIHAVTLGPQRHRRRMTKLLAKLDRIDRENALRLPSRPNTHRLGSFLVALLLVAGVSGFVYMYHHQSSHANAGQSAVGADTAIGAEKMAHLTGAAPTPGVDEHKSRLLPVATPPAGSGGYALLNMKYGPPRYDPCRPIHYVIREQDAPRGADDTIRQAVSLVSKATGLKFVEDGTTTEKPSTTRAPYQATRYGDRWAPVLIAWTNPTEIPTLKGDVAGLSGSSPYTVDPVGAYTYVSGFVYLDAPQLSRGLAAPHGDVGERLVIEHELGHLVGLGHVNDPSQIMNPSVQGLTDYRTGDLRGLAYEGRGACHPEL